MIRKTLMTVAILTALTSCQTTPSTEADNFDLPFNVDATELNYRQKVQYSKRAAKLGWDAFYTKNYDIASHRFNQSWILNNQNYKALWGMGALMGQRALAKDYKFNIKESIRFLEMAYKIQPRNAKLNADLAQAHTLLGKLLKSEQEDIVKVVENMDDSYQAHYDKAEELFTDSYKRDGYNLKMLVDFADFCIEIGDYKLAKRLVMEAKEEGYNYSPVYLKKLDKLLKTRRD